MTKYKRERYDARFPAIRPVLRGNINRLPEGFEDEGCGGGRLLMINAHNSR